MDKYGFVYIWRDRKHKRYYIGAHWGTEDDGYICSSTWMKKAYIIRPLDFKRRILSRIYTNKSDTFIKEQEWLNLIKPHEIKIKYYNLGIMIYHWCKYPEKIKSIKEKISFKLKEKFDSGWTRGPHSEETKRKIGESNAKRYDDPNEVLKSKERNKNNKPSENNIKAIKLSNTGRKQTEEQREKGRLSRIGRKWVNDGICQKFINFEEIQNYIDKGFKLGRLETTRKKLSDIGKTKIGPLNSFYGKRHTEECKEKK